jgi:DNA-binding transcriptional ArsR family regulator
LGCVIIVANICIVYYTVLRWRLYLVEQKQILQKISEQMDMLVSLFKLANSETINKEKEKIFKDPVKAKIIEVVPEDLPANELVSRVSSEVKQKERTIRYRLSELVAMGILKIEREGNKSFYRSSGLI